MPKLAGAPATLAGLAGRKGGIAAGLDADLIFFDPQASFPVDPGLLEHRHRLTPYAGLDLAGVVGLVILRGNPVSPLTGGTLLAGPRAESSTS